MKDDEIERKIKDDELSRKEKYDEMLEKYVRMIEYGERWCEDDSTYIKRISESMVSLGIAMCDFDKSAVYNINFITHKLDHIHVCIMEIIMQCYQEDPEGETSMGHFDVEGLKKWRKDNGM